MGQQESNNRSRKTDFKVGRIDFPTTNWGDISYFKHPQSTRFQKSIGNLYERYRDPLYILSIRSLRLSPDDASDMVHDFFISKVIDKNIVARANQSRGRFRSFISATFVNFVKDHWRTESSKTEALKDFLSMFKSDSESSVLAAITIEWCRSLVHHALDQLQNECSETGRGTTWIAFRKWFVNPLIHGSVRPKIEELTDLLQTESDRQTYNKIETGKRAFARHLRSLVGLYAEEAEIETEIKELMNSLSKLSNRAKLT